MNAEIGGKVFEGERFLHEPIQKKQIVLFGGQFSSQREEHNLVWRSRKSRLSRAIA
jgi:hypothetical protein